MNNTIFNPNQTQNVNQNIPNNQSAITQTLVSLFFQMLNKIARLGIDKTSALFNLDPNINVTESLKGLTSNLTVYRELLRSPEGKQLMSELSILLSDALEQLDKPINELTKQINELIDKEITVANQLLFNEIKIALGPIGSLIEAVNDTLTATSNAAQAASEVTGLFKNEVEKFNETKGKIDSWLEKLNTVSNSYDQYQNSAKDSYNLNPLQQNMNTNMNTNTSTVAPTQAKVNSTVSPNRSNFTSAVLPSLTSMAMRGGKKTLNSLKHIQKGGKMAAKRTKKSIDEFLNSGIKSSQILKKLKSKTRRRVKQ